MKRSCDFASEQQEVRRRAAFDMRGISLRNVPVSRSSSVPLRGRFRVFRVFRVCRRRNLRHQRVDWTYRGQPDGDAARCGQDNWVETDTHPCAAPGAGRLNGAHTHGPAREGPAPPSARDVSTGHTRTARRAKDPRRPRRGTSQRGTHAARRGTSQRGTHAARRGTSQRGTHARPGAGRPPSFFSQ